MSEELSEQELGEWIAFYGIEPFGEERADLRAGIVSSTIANVNRGKRGKATKPTDFMPFLKADSERQRMLKRPKGKALSQRVRDVLGPLAKKKDSK